LPPFGTAFSGEEGPDPEIAAYGEAAGLVEHLLGEPSGQDPATLVRASMPASASYGVSPTMTACEPATALAVLEGDAARGQWREGRDPGSRDEGRVDLAGGRSCGRRMSLVAGLGARCMRFIRTPKIEGMTLNQRLRAQGGSASALAAYRRALLQDEISAPPQITPTMTYGTLRRTTARQMLTSPATSMATRRWT
jgi:hypothetical protein